jgi:hypothetical protein
MRDLIICFIIISVSLPFPLTGLFLLLSLKVIIIGSGFAPTNPDQTCQNPQSTNVTVSSTVSPLYSILPVSFPAGARFTLQEE